MKARVGTIRAVRLAAGAGLLATVLALAIAPRAEAFLYWAQYGSEGSIARANQNGSGVNRSFIRGLSTPAALAVDNAHVYWTDGGSDIGRANLNGSGVDQTFIETEGSPVGVAVDAAHVYWTSYGGDISRANLNGSGVVETFVDITGFPDGIAVDGTHLYWAEFAGTIGRTPLANPNGPDKDPDFITGADNPHGVAVRDGVLYWANHNPGTIGAYPLDGSASPDESFVTGAIGPQGVAADSNHLYWANYASGDRAIGRTPLADPEGPGKNQSFITNEFTPWGIAVNSLSVPSCEPTSASTGHAEPVGMSLPCTSGGGQRTFSIVSGPPHGAISGLNASTGKLTYTPEAGFNGSDSFTFRVRNAGAASNVAQAEIEVAKASNAFEIGKAKKNKKKGTAKLPVEVPGAGGLELAKTRKVKGSSKQADGAGEVTLPVKARGKAKKKLKKKGKAKVTVEVTFSPVGGDPATQGDKVKLKRKRR
jgi:virginiamycin B lyase